MGASGGEEVLSHTAVLCLLLLKVKMCANWIRILVIGIPLPAPLQKGIPSVSVCQDTSSIRFPAPTAKVTAPTRPMRGSSTQEGRHASQLLVLSLQRVRVGIGRTTGTAHRECLHGFFFILSPV